MHDYLIEQLENTFTVQTRTDYTVHIAFVLHSPGMEFEMKVNEKLFSITLTDTECKDLQRLLNDVKVLYAKRENDFSNDSIIRDSYREDCMTAKKYRNAFAKLVGIFYTGEDA